MDAFLMQVPARRKYETWVPTRTLYHLYQEVVVVGENNYHETRLASYTRQARVESCNWRSLLTYYQYCVEPGQRSKGIKQLIINQDGNSRMIVGILVERPFAAFLLLFPDPFLLAAPCRYYPISRN